MTLPRRYTLSVCCPVMALDSALGACNSQPWIFWRGHGGSISRGRCEAYGRTGDISVQRWAVWAWMREFTPLSYPEIGWVTNTRHNTVREGVARFWEWGCRAEKSAESARIPVENLVGYTRMKHG